VENLCRCCCALRRLRKIGVIFSIATIPILLNLDLSGVGAYYSPSITNSISKHTYLGATSKDHMFLSLLIPITLTGGVIVSAFTLFRGGDKT
jgi:hypothetical protein